MNTSLKILIGTNNAYRWYAVLGAAGELIDCAAERDLQLSPSKPFEMYMVDALLDYAANGEVWEGRWNDAYAAEIEALADQAGETVDQALAHGEDTALALFGGHIEREING
jgi:hypothetical protein